jgi:hypothetical protein
MNFKKILILLLMIWAVSFKNSYSQDTTTLIGRDLMLKAGSTVYNFSNPNKVNFEVIVWGGVKLPGKYIVPEGTTLIDVITLSGGPSQQDILESFKLIRGRDVNGKYTSSEVLNLNYSDFFNREPVTQFVKTNPLMRPGDILIFPIEEERDFWFYTKEVLAVLTPLLSLASLIISISK